MTQNWDSKKITERLIALCALPTAAKQGAYDGIPDTNQGRADTFAEAAALMAAWMEPIATEVGMQDVVIDGQGLPNVWARVPGRDSSRAVLLQGHYDVVAVNGNFAPHAENGRIYGRGTTDMKGGVIAAVAALEDFEPATDVYLLWTCEEEVANDGIRVFFEDAPEWVDKVEFAISLESGFDEAGALNIGTRHPGSAGLYFASDASNAGEHDQWIAVRLETNQGTPHASAEPILLDPNRVMLDGIRRLGALVSFVESDRPIGGASNALAAHVTAGINRSDEAEVRAAFEEAIAEAKAQLMPTDEDIDPDITLTLTPKSGRRAFYDVADFASRTLSLRDAATGTPYTNMNWGRVPFTVGILHAGEGRAEARIDIRPDNALYKDLPELAQKHAPGAEILWNEPGLENPNLDAHPKFQRFLACAEEVCDEVTMVAKSGWTEAAYMTDRLGVPAVIAGPGLMGVAHKRGEYVRLDDLRKCVSILREFLA